MLDVFKKHNPNCVNITVVMADKDIKEREEVLPDASASVLICLFHTLHTFRRETSSEKMR